MTTTTTTTTESLVREESSSSTTVSEVQGDFVVTTVKTVQTTVLEVIIVQTITKPIKSPEDHEEEQQETDPAQTSTSTSDGIILPLLPIHSKFYKLCQIVQEVDPALPSSSQPISDISTANNPSEPEVLAKKTLTRQPRLVPNQLRLMRKEEQEKAVMEKGIGAAEETTKEQSSPEEENLNGSDLVRKERKDLAKVETKLNQLIRSKRKAKTPLNEPHQSKTLRRVTENFYDLNKSVVELDKSIKSTKKNQKKPPHHRTRIQNIRTSIRKSLSKRR